MAKLRMEIGPVVAEITIPDAKAQEIAEDIRATYGGPEEGTNQEKLQWVLRQVGKYMLEVSTGRRVRAAAEAARLTAAGERNSVKWE